MEKAEVIESLKHNIVPNEFERGIIFDIVKDKNIFLKHTSLIVTVFNFGKQCGIRRERKGKKLKLNI